MNVGILFGGKSEEHEVSCVSAYSIYQNIDREQFSPYLIGISKKGAFYYYTEALEHLLTGEWEQHLSPEAEVQFTIPGDVSLRYQDQRTVLDCLFPVLHGPYGEDGRLQGFLDYIGIPYVGNTVLSSAICMDKALAKDLLTLHRINQTKYICVKKGEALDRGALGNMRYPLFVKPVNMGSSVGITKVHEEDELGSAMEYAFRFDHKILIEEGVDAQEIECSVLEMPDGLWISTPGELIVREDFYSYDAKYHNGTTELRIPATLTEEIRMQIQECARRVFSVLHCKALARIDFFVDKNTRAVLVNEVNTMPGFTNISMYPKMLEHDGISYRILITRLIQIAMEDRRGEQQ